MKQYGSKISDENGKKLDNSPKYLALLIFLNFCVERSDSIFVKPAGSFVQNPKPLMSKSQKTSSLEVCSKNTVPEKQLQSQIIHF